MILNQDRIVKVAFLEKLKGKKIQLAVPVDSDIKTKAMNCGFSKNLNEGECVLPNKVGPATKKNAEGYNDRHKDKPMETCYRTIEWTRHQWIGRGETEEITEFTEITYKRYQRTFHVPYAMELRVIIRNSKKYIVSHIIECTEKEIENIKIGINVFLELFKVCHILTEDFSEIELTSKIVRLNWAILPEGEFPWEKRYEQIKPFLDLASPKNKPVVKYRLEYINKYKPDFVAIGLHGFQGYMVYGFSQNQLYIFESTLINNATYIFDKKWKDITKLTKKEILTERLQKKRIIHRISTWNEEIDKLFR